ncbi:MAG: hypothetical protein GY757_45570 [bacterium]|nr:hypothetical protein [bacterium]
MEEAIKEYIEKIEGLVYSASKFNEMSFRLILEGLVNKGGEDAEYLIVRYLGARDVDVSTRINIIRVVGYLQSRHFLIPLKKIIDHEENIHLKKEAVISVSKYNDRRALNILNNAVSNIKNPLLLDTINKEISKIKKNNPIFALLPRFLKGETDPKNFDITLGILKRILTANDATMFVNYLKAGKPVIENGAFDILCFTGNDEIQEKLFTFFQDRFNEIGCINEPECDYFYKLSLSIKAYFFRFPTLIDSELDNLGTQLFYIKDIRIRSLYMSILCQSRQAPVISFVGKIYENDPELRSSIVEEYSGNEAAVDLLFDKYMEDEKNLKGAFIKSLMNCQKGIDYFYQNFETLTPIEQEEITSNLPYSGSGDLSGFIMKILQAEHFDLKKILLKEIKENYEFSTKELLFDPDREREFFSMEKEYIETITHLFPITAIKSLLQKLTFDDVPTAKTKKFLQKISDVAASGFAFKMDDEGLVAMMFNRFISLNNVELTLSFLNIVKQIRTFSQKTYDNYMQAVANFSARRERKNNIKEDDVVRKIKRNFKELNFEIKKISEGVRVLAQLFNKPVIDFEVAGERLTKHSMSVALHIDQLSFDIETRLEDANPEVMREWVQLFYKFPMLGYQLKHTISTQAKKRQGRLGEEITRLHEWLPERPSKIVISLNSMHMTAMLKEQCAEILPFITVETETDHFEEGDMLLCDTTKLKDFILKNTLPSRKLFLLLDNRAEFPSFKSYNPRPLLKPFSAFKIMKEILRDLYL